MTKRMSLFLAAAAAAMILPATLSHANHGQVSASLATADGSVAVVGQYLSGDGDAQTWEFIGVAFGKVIDCFGFGSVEAGFVDETCNAEGLTIAGTGEFHPYLGVIDPEHPEDTDLPLHSNDVALTLGADTTTVTEVVVG